MAERITRRQMLREQATHDIVENARRLFAHKGYESVTVDDICDAANVGKSTFYNLFSSKEDLLMIATIEERNQYIKERFVFDDSQSLEAQFDAFWRLNFEYNCKIGASRTRLEYKSYLLAGDELPTNDHFYQDCLIRLIERGQKEGVISKKMRSEEVFFLLTDCLIGCLIGWAIREDNNNGLTTYLHEQAIRFLTQSIAMV